MEIKRKKETLKSMTYSQSWKQTSSTKNRFISTLDVEKGQFQLALLEPEVPGAKAEEFKTYVFSFNTK